MERDQLHQETSIVGRQSVAFESLDQRLAFMMAEFDLFWSLHRGEHPSDRQQVILGSGSTGGLV
jgi:hypothetical protein